MFSMIYITASCNSYTTGATSEAGNANPFRVSMSTSAFSGVHVAQSLLFCVVFCGLLFVFL